MRFCNIKGQTAKKQPVIPEGRLTEATSAASSFGGVKDLPSPLYPTPHCLLTWEIPWCAVPCMHTALQQRKLSHVLILSSASRFEDSIQSNLRCVPAGSSWTQTQGNLDRDPLSLDSIPLTQGVTAYSKTHFNSPGRCIIHTFADCTQHIQYLHYRLHTRSAKGRHRDPPQHPLVFKFSFRTSQYFNKTLNHKNDEYMAGVQLLYMHQRFSPAPGSLHKGTTSLGPSRVCTKCSVPTTALALLQCKS